MAATVETDPSAARRRPSAAEAREITLAGIRHRHPDWTDEDVHRELLRLLLGRLRYRRLGRRRTGLDAALRQRQAIGRAADRAGLAVARLPSGAGHDAQNAALLGPIGMLTGKDLTFTGRTDIWDILVEHIKLNPYLGTGYGAYWTGPVAGSLSNEFMLRLHFYPGSAHNGYLEILNDLGVLFLRHAAGYKNSQVPDILVQ
mgnify:CR=1 FL=1